jgi:hypothetical protein
MTRPNTRSRRTRAHAPCFAKVSGRAPVTGNVRCHQWADTKKPIRLETTGTRVKPERSTVQLRPSYRLNNIEMIQATPETLQHDLDKAFDKNAA